MDENGNLVDGDAILYLYGAYLKKRDKLLNNTVVATVMSNFGLGKALEKLDINLLQTAVGDRFVYEAMREGGYSIGGENSGHIIFSKYATTGDGMLTAIKVMQAMLDQKKTLSQLAEPLTFYPQVLKNVRVVDKELALNNEKVQQAKVEAEEMLAGDGRILLRKSGTEPVIRVMAECSKQELCNQCVDHIVNALIAEKLTK